MCKLLLLCGMLLVTCVSVKTNIREDIELSCISLLKKLMAVALSPAGLIDRMDEDVRRFCRIDDMVVEYRIG